MGSGRFRLKFPWRKSLGTAHYEGLLDFMFCISLKTPAKGFFTSFPGPVLDAENSLSLWALQSISSQLGFVIKSIF